MQSGFFCPITGDYPCKCPRKTSASPLGSALRIDLKAAFRKLFTDHLVYTNLVIMESVPILQEDADSFVKRLLRNPIDIANLLQPIVGVELAKAIKDQFTEHLKLANSALTPVRNGDSAGIKAAVEKFYAQGELLAVSIHNLSPVKLPYELVRKLIREHNEFVVKLASIRGGLNGISPEQRERKYEEYIDTYDQYFKHGMGLSDAIYEGLTE